MNKLTRSSEAFSRKDRAPDQGRISSCVPSHQGGCWQAEKHGQVLGSHDIISGV